MRAVRNISIIGDGSWGTTLALYLYKQGYHVKIWGAFPKYIKYLNKKRENVKFLPGIKIPKKIALLDNLKVAVKDGDIIILAVPSQFVVGVLRKLKAIDLSQKIILSVIKGVDTATLKRMSEIITHELGKVKLAVLSGPTIAKEIALGIPSTAVVASKNTHTAKRIQKIFHSKTFRIYTNSDVIGVELGGSIKNIIAIASGLCDGLGLGTNTKAALMTRGLIEMTRLSRALGAKTKTLYGLSGLGDLVTTCMSSQSRNRYVGQMLGEGKTIRQIVNSMEMVAEGVPTVKAIYALSRKNKINTPITAEVYKIIVKGKKPVHAVMDLMTRKLKSE